MTAACEKCSKRMRIHPNVELYICGHEDMPHPFMHGRHWPVLCEDVTGGECPMPVSQVKRDRWEAVKV